MGKYTKAIEDMATQNPANNPNKPVAERKRIPLSAPQLKLEVPSLPGYYLRWVRGTPQRIAQAERAGFEFVTQEELYLNDTSVGGGIGNTDMGSRVSVVEGGEVDSAGNPVRLYLMKQKMEYYLEDKALAESQNDKVAAALTQGFASGSLGGRAQGETAEDMRLRYVDPTRTRVPDLFRKKS